VKITITLTATQVEALQRALYVFDINYDADRIEELKGTGIPEALAECEKIDKMLDDKILEEKLVARAITENPGYGKATIRKAVRRYMAENA